MNKNAPYMLTEEGEKYLREGLPEVRLANSVKGGMSIQQARRSTDNFNIALQWAKKNGWIKIKNGKLMPAGSASETSAEIEGLKKVSKGKMPTQKELSLLLARKLVEKRSDISKEAERLVGKHITNLTPALIKTGTWRKVKFKPYNVTAKGNPIYPGKRQPYNQFLLQVRKKLAELGFKEMTGPMIELEFWNFDALYQAQDHPSRDWTQTYTLKYPKAGRLPKKSLINRVKSVHENGWKTGSTGWGYEWSREKAAQLMPRAHTTACSARRLAKGVEIPGKYFAISRCFRPDIIDATHGVEFNQTEGIIIDESLNFRHVLGILKTFVAEMAGADKVKFYPDYYPFTEPSIQISAKHPEMGWVELAGAGIFRPELTEPLGVRQPVIAWGFGIDRLAMYKLGVSDIRYLFSRNIEWLRNSKIVR